MMDNTELKVKGMAGEVPVYCSHDAILPLDDIISNPKNPNVHPAEQISLLKKIIQKQGWRSPIVISNRSGFVVKGHGRLMAALDGDMGYAPVDYQDYETEAAEYEDLIADNRLAELSSMENELLAEIFEEIGDIDFDMTGYSSQEIDEILGSLEEIEEETEEDEEPNKYLSPFVKSGDTWNLGENRLIVASIDPVVEYIVAQYVQQTGNVEITCFRDDVEHEYIDLLKEWAQENDVMDEVFSVKKPTTLIK